MDYTIDKARKKFILDECPTETSIMVYGVPCGTLLNSTHMATIIPTEIENRGLLDVFWQFIAAYAFIKCNQAETAMRLQLAEKLAMDRRRSDNRDMAVYEHAQRIIDDRGYVFGNDDTAGGYTADKIELYESDF